MKSNNGPARPSFSDEVKSEVAHLEPARVCCQHAELDAILAGLGATRKDGTTRVRVSRNALARVVVQLTKATGGTVASMRKGPTTVRPSYTLSLRLQPSLASQAGCCARATLRGAFLARGMVGSPQAAYHLEIALPDPMGGPVGARLEQLGLPVRRLRRRGQVVFYLKGAEPILRLLTLIGANRAVMRLQNDRILRELRGQANRRTNTETANLDRRMGAAVRQVEWIRQLQARPQGLTDLPPALEAVAVLRLAHPQARLQELADMAHVSKPALAGRLRRLMAKNPLID